MNRRQILKAALLAPFVGLFAKKKAKANPIDEEVVNAFMAVHREMKAKEPHLLGTFGWNESFICLRNTRITSWTINSDTIEIYGYLL